MHRRQFLRSAASGSVVLTMPGFLQGCGVAPPALIAEPLPEDPFLEWFAIDRDILGRVAGTLGANGADATELYFQHRRKSVLSMQGGAVAAASSDILQGVGMRVMRGDDTAFVHTEDLSEAGMIAVAQSASQPGTSPAPGTAGSYAAQPEGTLYRTALPWSEVSAGQKLKLLETVDRLARSADSTVSDVYITWSDADERILIAAADGRLVMDQRPMTRLSAQVTMTRDGVSHSGFANIAAREELSWYTQDRIAAMVSDAVARTEILFDARRPPLGAMPVVLSAGSSGVVLHEAIGHSLEADFVRSGESPYGDLINQSIADAAVTIVDEGRLPNERGALNYDDEGLPCRRNVLVESGVLRQFLHDRNTARQFSTESTASGRRESYRFEPMPRMTCTFMEDGQRERDELIGSMGRGIVAETITGGKVSLGDGNFRFRVKHGFLVEKGKVLMPVRDFEIAGNGPDMLANISMVANDGRLDSGGWSCGKHGQTVPVSQGMPSVLVSKLSVEPMS
jgi:TldD protein